MQYISAKEAAEKWGLTIRRVQDLCKNQAIDGAVRWGRDWMIPKDANRPADRRKKPEGDKKEQRAQLPRKNPAIVMSNIYHMPGTADSVADAMTDRPVAAELFRAQIAFCRGELKLCRETVEKLLSIPKSHDLQVGCGVILAMCALCTGDLVLWKTAKEEVRTAHCQDNRDRFAVDFWLGAIDSEIRETGTFPLWFTQGRFDVLPGDSYPPARFYYLKYMYAFCHEYAVGHRGEPDFQSKMNMFPAIAEPLIAQSHKEGALISELYQRLVCAVAYHDLGNDGMATLHLDKAIALALPDRLYMLLAEFRRQLDFLMDERLSVIDPAAAAQVRKMNQTFLNGWTVIHNAERGRSAANDLTTREREVAKLASFGLSNKEIAERLNISLNTVKQSLRVAMDKTGVMRRNDLFRYI